MTAMQRIYLLLADVTLIVHFSFVAFVIGGLVCIWVGGLFRWRFVRNPWFRVAHLVAIGFVCVEALTGTVCPLTTWEDELRLLAGSAERYHGSFVRHWLHQVLFFEADQRFFTLAYATYFGAVALSLWLIPPYWRRRQPDVSNQPVQTHL